MSQVKIVTDSTADLPRELIEKYNITVVPLMVIFNNNEMFRDGVDIDNEEFYRRQVELKEHSRTSQPAPAEFLDIYRELSASGSSIISIHLSAALSGTCQSARMAAEMLPNADIVVIDSKLASMGLGMIALEAARAADEGRDKNEILRTIRQMISEGMLYFIVDTLEYLALGGRIGKARALLGNILSIKPVLYLKDGIIYPLEKVRGRARAIDRLAQIISRKVGQRRVRCTLIHGMDPAGMQQLHQKIMPLLNCPEPVCSTLGAVIGTHTGLGALGIGIFPE